MANQAEHLEFAERTSQRIVIQVHPQADFREVLTVLEAIKLPEFVANRDNVKFAVLELLSNSLRAHREKREERKIRLVFLTERGCLRVTVRDYGGGFDPARLPYRLNDDIAAIDHTSPSFQEYQRKHGYQRFGMGLLVARRTFDEFRLSFFNTSEEPVDWGSGPVCGTLISCAAKGGANGG
jgi:anti-sigma regulatory factor (Ser/Thr protein kinase)